MKLKLLDVLTPPYIDHDWSTWKKLWEGKFTLCEFTPVNMNNFIRRNIGKHR